LFGNYSYYHTISLRSSNIVVSIDVKVPVLPVLLVNYPECWTVICGNHGKQLVHTSTYLSVKAKHR